MVTKNPDILHMKSRETHTNEVPYLCSILRAEINRRQGKLQGLALCQLSRHYRMFAVRDPKTKKFEYVVNPKVLFKFGILFKDEGCLSEEGRYIVARPICSVVRYTNECGEVITRFLWRKRTRIFMHEYDHLNGITLRDKKVSIRI